MIKRKILYTILPAFLAMTLALLTISGVFQTSRSVMEKSYDRPRILSQKNWIEPANLSEYLNVEQAALDVLLSSSKLENELLQAGTLADIVDSRLALNNLRTLQTDTAERIKTEARLRQDGASGYIATAQASGTDQLSRIQGKLNTLLTAAKSVLGAVQPQTDFKGVWTRDEKVLLHWTPHGGWIPADGYKLYRTIGGQSELVVEKLGTVANLATRLNKTAEYAEYAAQLFADAELTTERMTLIGVKNSAEFAQLAYRSGTANNTRARISGSKDYAWVRDRLLTVAGTLTEKLPDADAIQHNSLQTAAIAHNANLALTGIKLANQSALALKPMAVVTGYDQLAGQANGAARTAAVSQILEARKSILAKAFTDAGFAADTGLGYADDLSSRKLAAGTKVTYRLETATGESWPLDITTGQEQVVAAPAGLEGYGVDNAVSLRWQATADAFEKGVVAGYYIERKKAGEKAYTRLNSVPVAISYTLDESGIYFEAPIFYQDTTLVNGEEASYRIQALDTFGRISAYSAVIDIKVYKVTPPGAPSVDQPTLSSETARQSETYFSKLASLNSKVKGIIVPITKSTADTRILVVYRAKALGTGLFGEPAEIGRVGLENKTMAAGEERQIRSGKSRLILSPATTAGRVDLAFFDGDVEPGYSYKYWAAAVDNWGNESSWSSSRILGVPLHDKPAAPTGLDVALLRNSLPDVSLKPAGFGTPIVSSKTLTAELLKGTPLGSSLPAANAGTINTARKNQVTIGLSLSQTRYAVTKTVPGLLASIYGNLPNPDQVHALVALDNTNLKPDGSARVTWTPYSGEGLLGYHVYRAQVDGQKMADLQAMSKEALIQQFSWQLVQAEVKTNQIADIKLEKAANRIYLYLVFLVPDKSATGAGSASLTDAAAKFAPGGWMQLKWSAPADPQVDFYRIYRCEVAKFSADQDPAKLAWTLVGDQNSFSHYTEKVDQTYAHYYYYKVTSVSLWGEESAEGAVMKYRVPATSPPQTPAMLLPLQQKGKIQVNWAGVPHASGYIVYRTTLPKIKEEDILDLQLNVTALYQGLFTATTAGDLFLTGKLKIAGARSIAPAAATPILSVDKFNTLQLVAPSVLKTSISKVANADKLTAFQKIAAKYGPLALAPYGQLSEAAAKLVVWEKIAEVPVTEGGDPLAAYKYVDEKVVFGDTYLYTVQAKNDDDLYSGKPMPESASPRKSQAFAPVSGLKGTVENGKPQLSWLQAMDANLTWAQSREYVAGYIVYRGTARDGAYYQASPLLETMSWRDESADPYATNWYKVKVVDTAGYLSEYSEPVLVQATPPYIIKTAVIADLPRSPASVNPAAVVVPVISTIPVNPTLPQIIIDSYDQLTLGNYTLTSIKLNRATDAGTGLLSLGTGDAIEVNLTGVTLGTTAGVVAMKPTRIVRGTVTLKQPTTLKNSGATFSRLSLDAADGIATVDGYLQSSANTRNGAAQNLIGDLFALQLANAALTADGKLNVTDVPAFRYGRLIFAATKYASVDLTQPAIQLIRGTAEYHPGLETLDNKGLTYAYSTAVFNAAGQLTSQLKLTETQTLRLVIPAGLGIRATASTLVWKDGAVDKTVSNLAGKLILPFKTFNDQYVPPKSATTIDRSTRSAVTGFDRFLPSGIRSQSATETPAKILSSLAVDEIAELNESMSYLAYRIQGTSLLVLPDSLAVQETLSTVPINVTQWSGEGFVIPETTMTPANVGNCAEDTSDAIGVTPGKVAVDLDRQGFVQTQAPAETQSPFWLGIIVKEGQVALPSEYIKTNDNKRVLFQLTPGELLYDLNGIAYQNLTYSAKGIPVNFGAALGGFTDVLVNSCLIDLYGNKVNIQIDGDMGIPLFKNQRVKVKLFTSKELGKLVCTVAESEKFDPAGSGEVQIKVQGGYLQPDGLHLNGTLDIQFAGKLEFKDQLFNELIIPAEQKKLTATGNPDGLYGQALFDQPVMVKFHDFTMQLRSLSFENNIALKELQYYTTLTLWGGLQLSDNLTLNASESTDRLVISQAMDKPAISYEESKARMNFEFEQFLTVDGVVTPKASSTDNSIVEFETDGFNMVFNSAADLLGYPIQANVRMGYDRQMSRYFFALGSYYDDPEGGISFYYGHLNQISGIIGYNLDLPRATGGWYDIPKGSGALFNAIDSLQVNREAEGNYFFASTCNLYFAIGYADISIPICDVRDCYILVEKGPKVESGGDFYAPFDIERLITGKGFIKAGYTKIGYYHPERLFQFTSVLEDIPAYTFEVSGEVGFEMNPVFWEFRIGYPDALKATANSIFEAGFGIAFRDSDVPDDSFVKAQMYFNYDTGDITISPVYVRAYLFIGAEGLYEIDQKRLKLNAWLNGGAEGGIKAFGKRYSIIHLMVNANGEIIGQGSNWSLSANVRIHYSLDLWLDEIEGSVNWHVSKTL